MCRIKSIDITYRNILGLCLFLCAFFCTSPVLALIVGGRVVSFYNVFLLISIIVMLTKVVYGHKIVAFSNKETKIVMVWLAISLISHMFGMIYYINREMWFNNALSYLIKTTIYILLSLLLFSFGEYAGNIIKGLEWGAIINLIWVGIDAIYYYVSKSSLTNSVFSSYIIAKNVRYGSIDTFDGGMIRPAGFNTDPASVGLFAPFILMVGLVEKKIWLIVLAASSVVFSGSNTSTVCCIFVCVIYCSLFVRIKMKFELSARKVMSLVIVSLIVMIGAIHYRGVITNRITMIVDRYNSVYGSEDVENIRIAYIKQMPNAIINQAHKVITGTGFNSSSEAYLNNNITSPVLRRRALYNIPYDIENLYISYFFDCGLVGFTIFTIMIVRLLSKAKRGAVKRRDEISIIGFSAMLAVISSSFFYHYTLYSFHILLWCAVAAVGLNPKGKAYANID